LAVQFNSNDSELVVSKLSPRVVFVRFEV
jgi:hypothetical protein